MTQISTWLNRLTIMGLAFAFVSFGVFFDFAFAATWNVPGDASTIQGGIELAAPGDIVLVAPGTYHDCTHPDPSAGEAKYNCVIMKSGVTLLGDINNPANVVIDAQFFGRVIHCADLVEPAAIEGITIRNGYCGGGGFSSPSEPGIIIDRFSGGGLAVANTSLIVQHCNFDNNIGDNGGAVFVGNSSVSFSYCNFFENSADSFGGGIEGDNVTLEFCHFDGNISGFQGGGVHGSDLIAQSCLFEKNTADEGGAISGNIITLLDCSLRNNESDLIGGGAISGGNIYAYNTDFVDNVALNGIGPTGLIAAGSAAELVCCIADLIKWDGEGTTTLDNSECPMPVAETETSWGSVKSMFR